MFREKWMTTLWNASMFDVWWIGDSCFIAAQSLLSLIILTNFSLTSVSASIHVNNNISHAHLCAFNHFLFFKVLWRHLGKSCPWPPYLLWIWLPIESHLASIMLPSPFLVKAAHQYMRFTMLFSHKLASLQLFFFATFLTFFLKAKQGLMYKTSVNSFSYI